MGAHSITANAQDVRRDFWDWVLEIITLGFANTGPDDVRNQGKALGQQAGADVRRAYGNPPNQQRIVDDAFNAMREARARGEIPADVTDAELATWAANMGRGLVEGATGRDAPEVNVSERARNAPAPTLSGTPASGTAGTQTTASTAASTGPTPASEITPRANPADVAQAGSRAAAFNSAAYNDLYNNNDLVNGEVRPGAVSQGAQFREIQGHVAAANAAAARGDFATALAEYRALGMPLQVGRNAQLTEQQVMTGYVVGDAQVGHTIAANSPGLRAMNGMYHHMELMADMQAKGVTPLSDPPTRDQINQYLQNASARAQPNTPAGRTDATMRAMQLAAAGSLVHYRQVSGNDIAFPTPAQPFVLRPSANDASSPRLYFNSESEARAYATANHIPLNRLVRLGQNTGVPQSWSEVTAPTRTAAGGRVESDCQTEAYMWMSTIGSAPGFRVLGAINVQNGSSIGHELGVVQGPDGRVFVTSGTDPATPVQGTGPNGAVTHEDIMRTARAVTAQVYHQTGDSLTGFNFFVGVEPDPRRPVPPATSGPPFEEPGVGGARDSAANGALRYTGARFNLTPWPAPPTTPAS